jgi:hypothetical protein
MERYIQKHMICNSILMNRCYIYYHSPHLRKAVWVIFSRGVYKIVLGNVYFSKYMKIFSHFPGMIYEKHKLCNELKFNQIG